MDSPAQILERALQLHEAGQLEQAAHLYRALISLNPHHAEAMQLLGVIEHQSGRHDAAIDLISRATAIEPAAAHYWINLAEAQRAARHLDAAEASLRRAIALSPALAAAHHNLALLLDDIGRETEARSEYDNAIRLAPSFVDAHVNLARHAARAGDLPAAIATATSALRLDPGNFDARVLLGQARALAGELAGGIELLHRALQVRPDPFVAWHLANALREIGAHDECIAVQRQSVALDPNNPQMHAKLLFNLHYAPAVASQAIAQEHFGWAQKHADPIAHLPGVHVHPSHQRLRIGYVSGDYRCHTVRYFLQPLLKAHDRDAVEIYCYSTSRPDRCTDEFRALAAHWRDIERAGDDDAARLIRADEIDVLVDLSGHSGENRLLLFARKPAPIQATYLGYADTTGMSAIDYRITDAICDPPGLSEHLHREQLARISAPFLVYEPPPDAPLPPPALPIDVNGHVRFGSFNRPSKISAVTIEMWSRILAAVPDSRLVVKGWGLHDEPTRNIWRDRFAAAGVDPARLELLALTPDLADHLRAIASVDIALDTSPYNGTTTTCETLLMSVPVITLAGQTHVSRVGLSLLTAMAQATLAAHSPDDYVTRAVALARDLPRLRDLRRDLRDHFLRCPATNASRVARELQALYRSWTNAT